jgi:hypothetical protein
MLGLRVSLPGPK